MPRPTLEIPLVLLALAAPASPDEKLAGIACRSVHLAYPGPAASAFVTEVTVEKSAPGTYFCACGFNQGYFGIQEQGRGKKVVIFSIWDPGKQDDPNSVAEEMRVKLVSQGEGVRVGRFGNEGTGGQSFLDLDWKVGEPYQFLVTAKLVGDRTEFAGSIRGPGEKAWRPIATFSTLAGGKVLGGYSSFVEDFRRDEVSATHERRARYGDGWIRTAEGRWVALTRARFTADSNPARNIDAGAEGGRFFLATGGEVENKHTPLLGEIDLRPASVPDLP